MIQKHKTLFKRISMIIAAVVLAVAGFFAGRWTTTDRNEASGAKGAESQDIQINVKTIAVVNSDTGTYVNGEYTNYAARLLDFLDENYVMTNIEAARSGVENGTYAAYILIPSSFSENLVSLNQTPVKVNLEYAINGNLIEERRVETVYRIVDFERNLNNEMGYMYLAAILDEFHDVQDGAQTIRNNDTKEADAISAIQSMDLIEMVPVPELLWVDNSVEPLEITDYNSKNEETVSEIEHSYAQFIALSETDMTALKEQGNQLTAQWNGMENVIQEIDLTMDEEGKRIYEEGLNDVEDWLTEYNDVTLAEIESEIAQKSEDISVFLNEGADELETAIIEYNTDILQANKEAAVCEIMSAIETQTDKGTVSANTIMTILDDCITPFQDTANIDGEETTVTEYLRQKGADIQSQDNQGNSFFIPRIEVEELSEKIQSGIVIPVIDRANEVKDQLVANYENEKTELKDYNALLGAYDPLEKIDESVIQGYIEDMRQNNTTLHTIVVQNYTDNMEYVKDVYESTEENLDMLQQNISDSKDASDQAVAEGLEELKSIKSNTSEVNQSLLDDFVAKLPYTRVGNLQNTQVCDFIVDPIILENLGEIDTVSDLENHAGGGSIAAVKAESQLKNDSRSISWIWYALLTLFIVLLVVRLIYTLIKRQEDDVKENLIS